MAEIQDQQEEGQEQTYKDILAELDSTFVDDSFAPDKRSILTQESVFELNSEEVEVLQDLEYARLSEIYDTRRTKFLGNISPDSIEQGCL